jgi:hypothetical protein
MSIASNATVVEARAAAGRLRLAVGDLVRVTFGTPDPDFPGMRLDGWVGRVVEADASTTPALYLVEWNERTMRRMSPGYRVWCRDEDLVVDRMWLFEEDLHALPT